MTILANRHLHDVAKREVNQRRRVYERLVYAGKMTQRKATYEITAMEQIAEHFRLLAEQDDKAERLL